MHVCLVSTTQDIEDQRKKIVESLSLILHQLKVVTLGRELTFECSADEMRTFKAETGWL